MSIPMLQGQSGGVGEEDGSEGLGGPFPGLTSAGNTVVSPRMEGLAGDTLIPPHSRRPSASPTCFWWS